MEWLRNNILSMLAVVLLGLVLYNQYEIKKAIAEVQIEVNGIDDKLDYLESDINQIHH